MTLHSEHQFSFDIFQYYRAWKLLADDPILYDSGYYREPLLMSDTLYERSRVNTKYPGDYGIRFIKEVFLINYFYHYSRSIRSEGEKQIQKNVTMTYIDGVNQVQQAMQREIGRRGLAIETNPTSNLHISTIKQYNRHPILNLYNRELEVDTELLEKNPQLLVSINTDDQGIFNTSLENEYALLACSLENITDSDEKFKFRYPKQRVYAWLDSIRKMGLDQSFLRAAAQRDSFEGTD